jgi:hypothetical protein
MIVSPVTIPGSRIENRQLQTKMQKRQRLKFDFRCDTLLLGKTALCIRYVGQCSGPQSCLNAMTMQGISACRLDLSQVTFMTDIPYVSQLKNKHG